MVSSLVGDTRSVVPSSSSSESLEEQHPPKAQVLDSTSYHRIRIGASYPPEEENHRILYRTQPHTVCPPPPPPPHSHVVERSGSSVPSPPPVTPSPSSPTQTPYRFETPAYVFAPSTSNVLELLKSSSGCTCKKSRCLKLYCQCFASSTTCGPKCRCGECHNTTEHSSSIDSARRAVLLRNPAAFQKAKMFQQPQRNAEHALYMPSSPFQPQPMHRYQPQYAVGGPTPQYPPPPMTHSYAVQPPQYAPVMVPPNHLTSRSMVGGDPRHFSSHRLSHYPPSKQQRYSPPGPDVAPDGGPFMSSVVVRPHKSKMNPSFSHQPTPAPEGCKCRRSFCLKKYCECYQKSAYCTGICKCMNCCNFDMPPMYSTAMVNHATLRYRPEHPVMMMMMPQVSSQPPIHRVRLGNYAGMTEPAPVAPLPTLREGPPMEDEAMMQAAMAMTELLNGFTTSTNEQKDAPISTEYSDPEPTAKRPSFDYTSNSVTKKIKVGESADSDGHMESSPNAPSEQEFRSQPTDQASPHMKPGVRDEAPSNRPNSFTSVFHNRTLPTTRSAPSPVGEGRSSVYEDVTRSCGLPKPLSFRKICSRCGKTRSEHGENGFGNKCIYEQCGKCGASAQQHAATGHVMGVLCQLSEREGAVAGAATNYERKIRDLAKRADLQRGQRVVLPLEELSAPVMLHPMATITSPRATTMAQ